MTLRVLILGAGFGGLELGTSLSEALGDTVAITLIDKSDAFVFGYSKLDVMFGRATMDAAWLPYRNFAAGSPRSARDRHGDRSGSAPRHDPRGHPRRRHSDHRSRRGLRRLDHARDHPGRERVLLGCGSAALARCASDFHARARRDRRVRSPLQMPAGAERVRADAARPSADAGRAQRLSHHAREPAPQPGAPLAGDVPGADRRCSRAQHRLPSQPPGGIRGRGAQPVVLDDGASSQCDTLGDAKEVRAPDVVVATGMTENGW